MKTPAKEPITWAVGLAVGISYLINPLYLPGMAYGLLLRQAGAPSSEIGAVLVAVLTGFLVLPVGYILVLLKQGRVTEIDVPIRQNRTRPLLFSLGCIVLTTVALGLWAQTATLDVLALSGAYLLNVVVLLIINFYWKISIHLMGIGTLVAVLLWLNEMGLSIGPMAWTGVGVAVLLVMWARLRLKAHSVAQVVVGFLAGMAVTYLGLLWFNG